MDYCYNNSCKNLAVRTVFINTEGQLSILRLTFTEEI